MATRITATELARNLSDILSRVRYKGETFEIVRGGDTIAELKATGERRFTVADFIEFWSNVPKPDPEFWDDVEEAHRTMNQPLRDPWES